MAAAFKWQNTQSNAFLGAATSTNVGATNALGSNGSFTAGDILIAAVMESSGGTGPDTIVPPAGWTQIGTKIVDASNALYAWFYHVCNGSESGSFTFTWTNSNFAAWTLVNYSGCSATPVDASLTSAYNSATPFTTGSITLTNAGDMLVLMVHSTSTQTLVVPADMASRYNVFMESGSWTNFESDRLPGATGGVTETFSYTGTTNGAYMLIGLLPAGGAAASSGILGLASSEW